jgi:hypothetical protein
LKKLEAAIGSVPNTKTDVKTGAKELGTTIREFAKMAKALGMTKSPDKVELQMQSLQQQQKQQFQ